MIFNPYAIIDAMVSFLRVGFGLWVGWLGVVVWVKWGRHASDPEEKKGLEDRSYLLFLLAGLLLLLNFLSWPVFYLLLQSYVTEWPDVMCIYGVTRIGVGSMSISRFLPLLLAFLQVTKPLVVFLSGAWFTLLPRQSAHPNRSFDAPGSAHVTGDQSAGSDRCNGGDRVPGYPEKRSVLVAGLLHNGDCHEG